MAKEAIQCPRCKQEITLTEALSAQIREELQEETRKSLEAEYGKRLQEDKDKLLAESAAKARELEEKEKKLTLELQQKLAEEKAAQEKALRESYEKKLEEDTGKRLAAAVAKAREETELELKDTRNQLGELKAKADEAARQELEIRKKARELEEKQSQMELEMARKLDQERTQLSEEHRRKDLENEKKLSDMRKQIEELKRKSEQGSQQLQGEVLELELEQVLQRAFPHDRIEPVPTGYNGADVLQRVYDLTGECCGTIIWESKNAKHWSNPWLDKLKADQIKAKAELAVIRSTVLPENTRGILQLKGVWVTDISSSLGLAIVLRQNLMELKSVRAAAEGKNDKMELIYDYLSGPQFQQRVQGIVETFVSMKEDLDKEKRAINSQWQKREKQLELIMANTTGIYGDIKGIAGASIPQIDSLELKALGEGEPSDNSTQSTLFPD